MTSRALICTLGCLLSWIGSAPGQAPTEPSPPELLPPVLESRSAPKPLPVPPRDPATLTRPKFEKDEHRPFLVIPGVTAPIARRTPTQTSISVAQPPQSGAPALTGPDLLESPDPVSRNRDPASEDDRHPSSLPPALEPVPDDDSTLENPRPRQSVDDSDARAFPDGDPAKPNVRRNTPGVFGRLLPPSTETASGKKHESSIAVEPGSDPEAEAIVKRRVEKQVQQTVGDRLRQFDVRVTGRNVTIRARVRLFWQRRSVRRSLEGLSLPSGYRAKVEMLE